MPASSPASSRHIAHGSYDIIHGNAAHALGMGGHSPLSRWARQWCSMSWKSFDCLHACRSLINFRCRFISGNIVIWWYSMAVLLSVTLSHIESGNRCMQRCRRLKKIALTAFCKYINCAASPHNALWRMRHTVLCHASAKKWASSPPHEAL